jgi:hypothetical protein
MVIRENADELDVELRAALIWDLPIVSLDVGVLVGASAIRQSFSTAGVAPQRWAGAATAGAVVGVHRDIGAGFHLHADVAAQTYFLREQASTPEREISLISAFALRTSLAVGKRW